MNPVGSSTNFPQGFANGLSVRGMPLLQMQPGQVFFVGNSTVLNPQQRAGSNGNRGTFLDPFATLNYAVNTACVASRGDIVFVLPGHAETITDAATITLATAGVAVVGLGGGSLRPTITYATNTTANIPVTAANVSVQNLLMLSTVASCASGFTTTGTALAPNFAMDNIEFRDTSSTLNFLAGYTTNTTTASQDGFSMTNCRFWSTGTGTRTAFINGVNIAGLTLVGNYGASLQTTVAMLMTAAATSSTGCNISYNRFEGAHTSSTLACGISGTGTAWNGVAHDNYFFSLASGTGIWIPTTTKLALFQNYSCIAGAYATQGALNPITA